MMLSAEVLFLVQYCFWLMVEHEGCEDLRKWRSTTLKDVSYGKSKVGAARPEKALRPCLLDDCQHLLRPAYKLLRHILPQQYEECSAMT